MMITLLPDGPTMNFKLSSVKLSDEIKVIGFSFDNRLRF